MRKRPLGRGKGVSRKKSSRPSTGRSRRPISRTSIPQDFFFALTTAKEILSALFIGNHRRPSLSTPHGGSEWSRPTQSCTSAYTAKSVLSPLRLSSAASCTWKSPWTIFFWGADGKGTWLAVKLSPLLTAGGHACVVNVRAG